MLKILVILTSSICLWSKGITKHSGNIVNVSQVLFLSSVSFTFLYHDLTQGSLEFSAFLNLFIHPFCKDCTPIISVLADQRKRAIAVSMLTSSRTGLEVSEKKTKKKQTVSLLQKGFWIYLVKPSEHKLEEEINVLKKTCSCIQIHIFSLQNHFFIVIWLWLKI